MGGMGWLEGFWWGWRVTSIASSHLWSTMEAEVNILIICVNDNLPRKQPSIAACTPGFIRKDYYQSLSADAGYGVWGASNASFWKRAQSPSQAGSET